MTKNERRKAKRAASGRVTEAQERTLNRITRQTRDLKKEQVRIVGPDGTVLAVSKGERHEVRMRIGTWRDYGKDAVGIHNHPSEVGYGGPPSLPDLSAFGYGVSAIQIAAPEGVYRLTRISKENNWVKMRDAMEAAGVDREYGFLELRGLADNTPAARRKRAKVDRVNNKMIKAHNNGASKEEMKKLSDEYDAVVQEFKAVRDREMRKIEVKATEDFLKDHAAEYGFLYEFTPRKTKKK